MANAERPVSYTHLDVYKRQAGKSERASAVRNECVSRFTVFYEKTGQSGMKKTHESTKIMCEQ